MKSSTYEIVEVFYAKMKNSIETETIYRVTELAEERILHRCAYNKKIRGIINVDTVSSPLSCSCKDKAQ